MKKTKKIIAVLFAVALVCATLAACGGSSNDPIVGTWKMTGAEAMGQTVSLDDYLKAANTKEVPTFEFKGDNTLSASGMAGQSGSGKWEVKDGKYTISDDTSMTIKATIEGEKLKVEAGGATLIFEKE